ncbi:MULTISPECIES: DUF2897 family protein [Pseudomonadaceae]|jgi:hypothetical protein|uniref:DUF2897 family protein n=5 Tax=Pseudomonadaceae TaxID=135621 RepID=A0A1I5RHG9_9GAMM|nr:MULTISPECIES: DUF2897 family protein [Pseudomonas]MAE23303.1 DUF2897 domain-containing protein [Pseudomonas sp.]MBJ7548495.1 DUF2897 family protein [Pseudomonas sp. OA3]APU30099.1 DUF2897 domain-containing protein [Pseudomonas alcaliphila JAB1]AQZ34038.1 DUF2897 domain-containing protein [Pseudomonas sp. LPH1]ERH48609.1 hypothetical protein O203_17380 [Pseudomonas chengduensis]|tara:strand:+ start:388 stop:561 length:174 start_codon:yes stop_codon:yes gene_type:complete
MPWYVWLLLVLVFGSVIGSLLVLRSSAKKMPLSEDQLERMRKRAIEQEAKDARERQR